MTDELHSITFTIEIEPNALSLLQQQADQQGLTLDQLAARSIGRAAAQVETQVGHIRACQRRRQVGGASSAQEPRRNMG